MANNNLNYTKKEILRRRNLISYFNATNERFSKGFFGKNFYKNIGKYRTKLVQALYFDEDQDVISTVLGSYRKLKEAAREYNYSDVNNEMLFIESFMNTQYQQVVTKYWR